jgi:DNA-directed RNA polymerase I, II, and III subunit RPABC1
VIAVFITEETKTGVKTIRKLKDEAVKQGACRALVMCPEGLTPFAAREVKATQPTEIGAEGNCHLEIFTRANLAFNVTRHVLVPQHRILSASEKRQLLADLSCKIGALPKIKEQDPVVRYLGVPPGTVLAVERQLGRLETETFYRVVVA